jgi:hypothetical protein
MPQLESGTTLTVSLPAVGGEIDGGSWTLHGRLWQPSLQPGVRSMAIIVMLELEEFSLQIRADPKQRPVQEFAPNRGDQALDERMGKRRVRNRLDFCHLKDS